FLNFNSVALSLFIFLSIVWLPPRPTLFPYTTLFRSRTSVLVSIKDQPGALAHILAPLAAHNLSMNRIESRPLHEGKWQYSFFIDMAGHVDDETVRKALDEMRPFAAQIKVLGSYPVAVP